MSESINYSFLTSKVASRFLLWLLFMTFVLFVPVASYGDDCLTKEQVVSSLESFLTYPVLHKWDRDIVYSLEGISNQPLQELFMRQLETVSILAGVNLKRMEYGDTPNCIFFVTNNINMAAGEKAVKEIFGRDVSDEEYASSMRVLMNGDQVGLMSAAIGDHNDALQFYSWIGDPTSKAWVGNTNYCDDGVVEYFSMLSLGAFIIGEKRICDDGSVLHSRGENGWFSLFEKCLIQALYEDSALVLTVDDALIDKLSDRILFLAKNNI